ncbi:MAG TPA: holin [Exiguobacterium sp.]|uniref:phage holin n=1 Tax=Exiguobacterium sp. TaxID=44751 RepID=UPI000EB9F264|nr:phage holin [Exiguobacterium sp.]HCN59386.1 holin [Exiguobacterium sp.]
MKERSIALIRLIVPLYSFVNLTLLALGYTPLPFETNQIETALTALLGAGGLMYAWWKNNNMTEAAQHAQVFLTEWKNHVQRDGQEKPG